MTSLLLVVPCFNEELRLDLQAFVDQAADGTRFLFVDDGSTDATPTLLSQLASDHPDSFDVLTLEQNQGKAEAVRRGMLRAATSEAALIGYWDADLATPLDEVPRFLQVFADRPHVEMVLGSRVNLMGRRVRRKLTRHYLGRVFATYVSAALRLPVYDTQCGAKIFRPTNEVVALFAEPFRTRWIFDAEVLGRAIEQRGPDGVAHLNEVAFELPLMSWEDVGGSKVQPLHLVESVRDGLRLYWHHVGVRRRNRPR